jgi:hypothetical protein
MYDEYLFAIGFHDILFCCKALQHHFFLEQVQTRQMLAPRLIHLKVCTKKMMKKKYVCIYISIIMINVVKYMKTMNKKTDKASPGPVPSI